MSELIPDVYRGGPAATVVQRDVIRAVGPDTEPFLQGQLSQDLAAIAQGASAWTFLLQPQGKVDAWFRVTRLGESEFLLDVDAGFGEPTLTRLNRFKLRTDCDLTLETWDAVAVRSLDPEALKAVPAADGTSVPAEWPGVGGIDILGTAAIPDGVASASAEDLAVLRMLSGVPVMGAELTEDTIPAEAGVVERSVSFTKGCYTGQELVARIDSRGGNVPKRLRSVVGAGPLTVGDAVVVDGGEVGSITSATGRIGLAYIKRSVESFPAAAVVGDATAEIHELPLL